MFKTNIPEVYEKITVSSYDANGVLEAFQKTIDNKPEEITVLARFTTDDFAYGEHPFEIFVAPNGCDEKGNGKKDAPYATLAHALQEMEGRGGGVIYLRGGTYSLKESTKITSLHSGTEKTPLFITAYEGEEVKFTSTVTLSGDDFQKAADAPFLNESEKKRLNAFDEENAKKVYALDLSRVPAVFDSLPFYVNKSLQPTVYVDGAAYHVARFPNVGEANEEMHIVNGRINTTVSEKDIKKCGKVTEGISSCYKDHKNDTDTWELWLDDGDGDPSNDLPYRSRLLTYDLSASKLWTTASVYEEWDTATYGLSLLEDESGRKYLKSDTHSRYGAKHSHDNGLFFFNMLEELDSDGEYLIDPLRGILYIYAPDGLCGREITVSTGSFSPMVLENTKNVLINGITFERASGVAVFLNECKNTLVQACEFRHLTAGSIRLYTCFNSGVTYSSFFDCGMLFFNSAVAKECVPNRCIIQNNRFENATATQSVALRLLGVANVISHNYFYETSISFDFNLETVIEYNEFVRGSQIVRDNGPIYSGYRSRGMIIRYNLMRDLNYSGYGIYIDDMGSEHYIYGNIAHYGRENRGGRCVHLHNGNMNVVLNNLCISSNSIAFLNNLNYYPRFINGEATEVGSLSYRWEAIARDRLLGYYNYFNQEKLDERYPMYAWFTKFVKESIKMIDATPDYDPRSRCTPRDDIELFTRTPNFNIYQNNVAYDCKEGLRVPTIGRETCIIKGNMDYTTDCDIGFVDFENGNYQIKDDSILFKEIDGFFAPPFEKMGLTK